MAVKLSPFGPKPHFEDSNGDPLSGGLLYFYAAGSATPQDTYTTSAGTTANANPVVLNSRGEPANQIWFTEDATYKATLKTSAGVEIWSSDNLSGINDTSISQDEWVGGTTPTYISATSFSVTGDQSSVYHVGRRLKSTNTAGTIYSTISAVAYSSVTTVTVVNDSGSLDSGMSAVSYGLLSANFPALSPEAIFKKATAIAAAATTNIWATAGDYLHLTGTGTITSFGTAPYAGASRMVIFDGPSVIAHDGTAISLPGTATITAAANDRMKIRADTTTRMMVPWYTRALGDNGDFRKLSTYTSGTSTWSKGASLKRVKVTVVGGGGGGGQVAITGTSAHGASGGGGGGGASIKVIEDASLGATETVTVGAGGVGSSDPGGTGGTSSFGAHCSATGGAGGDGNASGGGNTILTLPGGAGGAGSGGSINISGGGGSCGWSTNITSIAGFGGAGGDSIMGGGGAGVAADAAVKAGGNYGGGGSGAASTASQAARDGGAGAAGVVIVEEFF